MRKEVGLWIDHRHAVIVTLQEQGEHIKHIESHVDKRVRYSGASQTHIETAPHDDFAEDKRDRRIDEQLARYYHAILDDLRDAHAIFVMGPGAAKVEFQKHLEALKLGDKIAGIEPADKLTDAQIAARVRAFFPVRQPA